MGVLWNSRRHWSQDKKKIGCDVKGSVVAFKGTTGCRPSFKGPLAFPLPTTTWAKLTSPSSLLFFWLFVYLVYTQNNQYCILKFHPYNLNAVQFLLYTEINQGFKHFFKIIPLLEIIFKAIWERLFIEDCKTWIKVYFWLNFLMQVGWHLNTIRWVEKVSGISSVWANIIS